MYNPSTRIFLVLLFCHLTTSISTISPTIDIQCIFKTSSSSYSGTSDSIYATFIGDKATSGPHDLGSFSDGSTVTVDITLDKLVGNLNSVLLYTTGTDGWLLSESTCELDGRVYALQGRRQWLDSLDTALLKEYGDGFEPFAQEDSRTLPASPTLLLSVLDSWRSPTSLAGVFKPHVDTSV